MSNSAWILGAGLDVAQTTASTNLSIEISKALEGEGLLTTIIPLNRQSKPVDPSGEIDGVQYRLIRIPFFDRIGLRLNNWIRGFVSLLAVAYRLLTQKERPRILFCMTMWWWGAFTIACYGKLFGLKTIYYLVEEPAALARMQYENRDTSWLSFRLKLVQAKLIYFAIGRFDTVCCIVRPLKSRAIDNGVASSRVCVMPNIRYLQREEDERDESSAIRRPSVSRILYTGRINYTRDEFETLLAAAELVQKSGTRCRIEIYGSGPKKDLDQIQKLIDEKDLESTVVIKGFVPRQELLNAQREATAFLLLKADIAQNRYNFPTKLMDYLDNGRPVIMTRIQNHMMYFEDKINCFFVDSQDAKGLHQAIRQCLDDPRLATNVGNAGREVLKDKFNATKEIKKLLAFAGLLES